MSPRRIGWGALASAAGLALLSGCSHDAAHTPSAEAAAPTARTVGVVTAAPEDVVRAISQPGTIQGIEEATLYARATGFLKAVYVDKGTASGPANCWH